MIPIKEKVDKMCRLCAGETKDGIIIYSSEGLQHCLEKKINVSEDDILPKIVCCRCHSLLEVSHSFLEQAKRAQKSLKLMLQITDVEAQDTNDLESKDFKLEEEFDMKVEDDLNIKIKTEYLPLDVVIESEPEENIKSLNYVTEQESPEIFEDKKEDRITEDGWVRVEQHTETVSTLFVKSEEEVIDEEQEDINIAPVSHSFNNCRTYKLSDIEERDLCETKEAEEETEEESDQIIQEEWKTHWKIKCNKCDETLPYRSQFDKHYRNSHNQEPAYTCSYCNKTIEKYATFRSHCYRHDIEGRYRCKQCGKGFGLQGALQLHVQAKHSSERKPFMCEQCGKGFVTQPGLKAHLLTHRANEVDPQEFPCTDCGKVLRTRGGLAAHILAHRVGRRFLCDNCGRSFTQKANLHQHQRLRHSGERPFPCPVPSCGKRFAEKAHLNRHCSFHSEKRPFQCTVCLKKYKTDRCLKVHAMVHSEVRPYVCSYCNKGFLNKARLKQHLNIHTGDRPYACQHCERKFTNYPNWLKHNRRLHKDVNHKASFRNSEESVQGEGTSLQSKETYEGVHLMQHTSSPVPEIYPDQLMSIQMTESILPL